MIFPSLLRKFAKPSLSISSAKTSSDSSHLSFRRQAALFSSPSLRTNSSRSRFGPSHFGSSTLRSQELSPLDYVLPLLFNQLGVLGHECGHGSFSDSPLLNDSLGYLLHTLLLVPYFSWQHSHALHHAKTNHLTEGETHNPVILDSKMGRFYQKMRDILGVESFACVQIFNITVLGWPLYLLLGVTGGSARGFTSHFIVPNKLFPPRVLLKVSLSNIGLCVVIYGLYLWA